MSLIGGRVCVVFGGSRGIGQAVCELLAEKGANVVVLGRNAESCKTVSDHLYNGYPQQKHTSLQCDIRNICAVEEMIKYVENNVGPSFALINSAGILKSSLLVRSKTSDIEDQVQTNLLGAIFTCRTVLRYMLKRREGHIVNVSSIVGLKGLTGESAYSSTKAGLVGLTKSLAKEVGPKNIFVNVVCPGFVQTNMTSHLKEVDFKSLIAVGRFALPREIAHSVLFLLESRYITGQVLTVDGGLQL